MKILQSGRMDFALIGTIFFLLVSAALSFTNFRNSFDVLQETNIPESAADCSQIDAAKDGNCEGKWMSDVPVCGSDGNTYPDLCSFRRVSCKDRDVRFEHSGQCRAEELCVLKRNAAQRKRQAHSGVYVPECEESGFYRAIQCRNDTGFCWCVTPTGHFTGAADAAQNLNCSHQNSGSSPAPAVNWSSSEAPCALNSRLSRCTGHRGGCHAAKMKTFTKAMVDLFLTGFSRQPQATGLSERSRKREAVAWKFSQLDKNQDGVLERREYEAIHATVRANIKPKVCAVEFPLMCDKDGDRRISQAEWMQHWRRDARSPANRSKKQPHLFRSKGGKNRRKKKRRNKIEPQQVINCRQDRENDRSLQTNTSRLFVPECDHKGRYRPYQCFGSVENDAWFCWCVNVITGNQLPGTYVKSSVNESLDCTTVDLPPKSWNKYKGCTRPRHKNFFQKHLLSLARTQMRGAENLSDQDLYRNIFTDLDTNGNGKLNRREIKKLQKKLYRSSRRLKRCGRHLHKVCDANDDRAIHPKEWTTCLAHSAARGRRQHMAEVSGNGTSSLPNWRWINPFVTLLKAEDTE